VSPSRTHPGRGDPATRRHGVLEAPTVSIPVLIFQEVTGRVGGRNPRRGRRSADQNELLRGIEHYRLRYNGISHRTDADHTRRILVRR
jgi:hypothetical protein